MPEEPKSFAPVDRATLRYAGDMLRQLADLIDPPAARPKPSGDEAESPTP